MGPAVQQNNIELLANYDNNTTNPNPNTQKSLKRIGDNQLKRTPYSHGINNRFWIKQKRKTIKSMIIDVF